MSNYRTKFDVDWNLKGYRWAMLKFYRNRVIQFVVEILII